MTGENETTADNGNNIKIEEKINYNKAEGQWGIRHLQVFLLFLGMMIAYGLRTYLSVAIVAMTNQDSNSTHPQKTFNWSSVEQGRVMSSFFWGYIVTQIPFGYLASSWSAQKLLSGGLFLCGTMSVAVPILIDWGDIYILLFCRIVMGLSQGCVLPGTQTLLARWVPPGERARLATFAYAGAQLGTVVAMPISGQLSASVYGWPSLFYFFGVLGIIWGVLFHFLGSDRPSTHPNIKEEEKLYIEQSFGSSIMSSKQKFAVPWKQIFTSLPMWALIIVHCGQNWGYWMLLTEIPTYMSKIVGFDLETIGNISALPYLAMWLLSFPVSWLSDLALRKGVNRGVIRKTCNTVSHWGPGLALIGLCYISTDAKTCIIIFLIIAVGLNAGSICGYQINHIDLSPNYAGTMMAITNCIAGIVSFLAPLISGYIVTDQESETQWHTVFYISALIYFLGNLIFIIFGSGELQWWNNKTSNEKNNDKSIKIFTHL